MSSAPKMVERGRQALARGDWPEARRRFQQALDDDEDADAYEGLWIAARYALTFGRHFTRTCAVITSPAPSMTT